MILSENIRHGSKIWKNNKEVTDQIFEEEVKIILFSGIIHIISASVTYRTFKKEWGNST